MYSFLFVDDENLMREFFAEVVDFKAVSYTHLSDGKNNLLFVLNMTPVERKDYCVGVPRRKNYKLVLNSDDKQFGGNGAEIPASIRATSEPCDYKPYRITFDLPASSALVYVF